MGFRDLKSPTGLQVLNDYLADKSFNEGYVPSESDVAVFEVVSDPSPVDLCHALRCIITSSLLKRKRPAFQE
ncbi:Elongation factor 1-beta [Sciurus carolinensis]|uniref:Elongation factor 1-beta n=1 Tax=Sciurus carolinensis TaxID=30640 RepID=A0AA41MP57_SCICA|nr:Elongation factor 1-beta [Sciurus carolinensis]